jgi:hypothetical protein
MKKDKQYFIKIGDGKVGDYILANSEAEAKKRFIAFVKRTMKVKEIK